MTPDAAIRHLRIMAIKMVLGIHVGSDQLVKAGLDALLAGLDTPSLPLLAGLTRAEEPEARQLFQHVVEELALAPTPPGLPEDPTARRWELVRWWAQLIVDGDLDPDIGGNLIWQEGWSELGYPDALQPIVSATCQYEDHASSYAVWDTSRQAASAALAKQITDQARKLLDDPWPPQH